MQRTGPMVEAAAATHVGHVRDRNEDSAVVAGQLLQSAEDEITWQGDDQPVLVAVLDGLGGHPDGDLASRTAARSLADAEDPADVSRTVIAAHAAILDAVADGDGRSGMGTTIAVAVVTADELVLGVVGDSPALLVGSDGVEVATPIDRARFGGLTSFAGDTYAEGIDPHVRRLPRDEPRRVLLTSDGLTDVLGADRIHDLAGTGTPAEAARALVDATLEAGAPDNVTVVVADVGATA